MSSPSTISKLNYANLAAYLLNCFVTYTVGTSGRFPTNAELSEKYQTIVTPAGYAFAIWGIIFTSQLIWALAQVAVPSYRSKELVVEGVGRSYLWVCIAQVLWTICFTTEHLTLSLAAMVGILIPLVQILFKSKNLEAETVGQYFLLKFPFQIHAGWIMAATLVNWNVVVVGTLQASATVQSVSGIASLIGLAAAGFYFTLLQTVYVIPFVLAWAAFAIHKELGNPKDLILSTFPASTIAGFDRAALLLAIAILILVVIRLVMDRLGYSRRAGDTEESSSSYTAIGRHNNDE